MLGTANATKVTLSFWVKSSLTGNFGGSFVNGAADRSYPFQYNISSANTWQKITETVQLDTSGTWATDNTTGLKILFDFGSGTTYQGTADTWASANYHTASSSVQLIGTGKLLLGISLVFSLRSANRPRRLSIGRMAMSCRSVCVIILTMLAHKNATS